MSKWTDLPADVIPKAWKTNLTQADATPQEEPGTIRWAERHGYGGGFYRYVQNKSGSAMLVGSAASFVAATTLTATATGTVDSFPDTGLGVNDYQNDLCICLDDAGAAGATPEGTGGFVVQNTAIKVSIDPDSPFGAAPVVGDTFQVMTNCHVIASASDDLQMEFAGIVQAASLADDYWGWVQVTGRCARANLKDQITITALQALILDTATLTISSTSALNKLVAVGVHGVSNDAGRLDYGVVDLMGYLPEFGAIQLNVTV